jgi:parvulin-like peptidyl-prolyl isomerase
LLEKGADFGKVAARFQLPMHTTGEFTAAAPDPQFKNAGSQLDSAAFKLTKQEPISDPIQVGDGFYVLHLASMADSRKLTLEEAKPKVVDAIKKSRSQELLATKGAEIARQLRDAIKSNQSIEGAAQKAGVKAEKIPPFTLMDEANSKVDEKKPAEPPDMMLIKNAAARLQPGEVSDFVPFGDGGVLVALEKREPPDAGKYRENKAAFEERYLNGKQEVVFYEWLRDRQHDAGLGQTAPPAG